MKENIKGRKAQGLPINTIIIAILAIAVLFVILFVFFRKGGEFTQATSDCVAQGGTCVSGGCSVDSIRVMTGRCADGSVCCRTLFKKAKGESCALDSECETGLSCMITASGAGSCI